MSLKNNAALVVIPPKNMWPIIQLARQQHDKSYTRWMPHINVFFPFCNYDQKESGRISTIISEKLKDCCSGSISFSGVDFFEHVITATIYLKPDDASTTMLRDIYCKISTALSLDNSQPYNPHLSVGQVSFPNNKGKPERYDDSRRTT